MLQIFVVFFMQRLLLLLLFLLGKLFKKKRIETFLISNRWFYAPIKQEIFNKDKEKKTFLRVKFLCSVDFFISRYFFQSPLSKTMSSENRVIFSENGRINSKSRGNLPYFQRKILKFVVKISGKRVIFS
jgi:hypothetical protein